MAAGLSGQIDFQAVFGGALTVGESSRSITLINSPGNVSFSGGGASQIFIHNAGTFTVNGFLFTNGFTAGNGGAIDSSGGTLNLNNCQFHNNSAGSRGGAVFASGNTVNISGGNYSTNSAGADGGAVSVIDGVLNVNNSTITNNTAVWGGGLHIWYFGGGSLNVFNSIISNNTASFGGGIGGFSFAGSVTVNVTGSQILSNSANLGGGIWVDDGNTLSVTGSILQNNTAINHGGGIYSKSLVTLSNTSVSSNTADSDNNGFGDGGGIWSDQDVFVQNNSVIDDNTAINGGGIYCTGTTVTIDGSRVGDLIGTGNSAVGGSGNSTGGGIYGQTVILQNGAVVAGNSAEFDGGGIWANNVTLTNSTVSKNTADSDGNNSGNGGGIYAVANLTASDSVVQNNTAVVGGGIYAGTVQISGSAASVSGNQAGTEGSGIYATGAVTLSNGASVKGNSAGSSGGGIYSSGGNVNIQSGASVSNNNAAVDGGGIWAGGNVSVTGGASVSLNTAGGNGGGIFASGANLVVNVTSGAKVNKNVAGGDGGGIWFSASTAGTVNVSSATVDDNTAAVNGGGLYVSAGTINLTNATVSRNTATNGSGGGIYDNAGSNISIVQSTIGRNTAANLGGGVFSSGPIQIYNSTITQNRLTANSSMPNRGAGVRTPLGSATIESTIISGNTRSGEATTVVGSDNLSFTTSHFLLNNLIGNQLNSIPVTGLTLTSQVINTAAGLANHGGLTETYKLAFGSPAVDTGSNPNSLSTDQRGFGFPRLVGAGIDIGATEGTTAWTNAVAFAGNVNLFDAQGNFVHQIATGLPSVRIALGDVTGDGITDVVAGAGKGGGAVRVYNGVDGKQDKQLFPYGNSYTQGVTVATGDVDNDGDTDIVVGPGSTGLPVRVLDYATSANGSAGSAFASFNPFYNNAQASKYQNGVRVSAGDLNGDGDAEVVVSTASPQAALVQVFNYVPGSITKVAGVTVATNAKLTHQFAPSFAGSGAYTAVLGPGQVVVGSGSGPARFQVFNLVSSGSSTGVGTANPAGPLYQAFSNPGSTQEVRVAVRDIDGDGTLELLAATGPNGAQQVRVFDAANLSTLEATLGPGALLIPPTYTAGLFV